ncbi:MAG: 2Fe-2S iron-sulfur cluster binding domain-containing protein [Flavobacteriaceae bacterium]|nr:2Fe-2S iron-sulfur cluster binding domain-containing protein [Flavobacteriaceae bacterium]
MPKFHSLRVKDLYKDTEQCSVIEFAIPEDLKNTFKYKAGQYLTLRETVNGEDIRRSYSLCSSPIDDEWKVAVKQITDGKFSTYVNQFLKKDDILQVMKPMGRFGTAISEIPKNYIVFTAGSGITPILSMIKTHLAKEPNSTFKLFYLNRTVKSIIFKEEIEQLRNQYFGRLEVFYFLTKESRDIELFNGRFTKEKLTVIFNKLVDVAKLDECFLCGPEEMIFLVKDELMEAGMPKEHIHFELFVTGLSTGVKTEIKKVEIQKKEEVEVTIIDGGKEFHFGMNSNDDNVLDAALVAGADLPFACKGGVCSTCKCRVIEGSVKMKVNYALDEKEVSEQFVLSCQAVPTSKKVILNFDV